MVRSLHELEWREEKGEDWGFARRGGIRAAMSQKEEKGEGKWGVRYGSKGGDREPTGCPENRKRIVHDYGGCGIMPWLREDEVLVGPDTDGVHRARGNSDLACVV